MARAKASPLAIKKKRLELPVSKKPRFESLGDGVSLGYRRNQGGRNLGCPQGRWERWVEPEGHWFGG